MVEKPENLLRKLKPLWTDWFLGDFYSALKAKVMERRAIL
jgi:hypothetical protein